MGERKTVYLKCEIEEIPGEQEISQEDWSSWCEEKGIYALAGSRRGWWSDINTYIRGATHIVYFYGTPIEIIHESELADLTEHGFAPI